MGALGIGAHNRCIGFPQVRVEGKVTRLMLFLLRTESV